MPHGPVYPPLSAAGFALQPLCLARDAEEQAGGWVGRLEEWVGRLGRFGGEAGAFWWGRQGGSGGEAEGGLGGLGVLVGRLGVLVGRLVFFGGEAWAFWWGGWVVGWVAEEHRC